MSRDRWVCLDVGEVLIDETRVWSLWADVVGVPRFTFMAVLGAVIADGGDHRQAFEVLDMPEWRSLAATVEQRYGGFVRDDLYPDALPVLAALRDAGLGVAVFANQPASRRDELWALGVRPDVIAMSDALGVHKPDAAFFTRTLALLGGPAPGDVAYVGDRVDNDVAPSRAAGLRPVWLRRGPWGRLQRDAAGHAAVTVWSLHELVARLDEVWPARVSP